MQGRPDQIINPIRSARMKTTNSFRFKYGKVEVRAKMPRGDWLWPAIWMLPYKNAYGGWPKSGEIDLVEARGNDVVKTRDGGNIGNEQVTQTLHFGAFPQSKGYWKNDKAKYCNGFHLFKMEWTPGIIELL